MIALALGIGGVLPLMAAGPAGDPLQTAIRDRLFNSLKPEQRNGLTKASPIDPMIGRLDLQQRQSAAGQFPPLEKQFSDPKSLSEIGTVYLKLGASSEAARLAGKLKAKYPDSALGSMLEAKAKAESGDTAGALASAKAAAMQEPGNAEVIAYFKLLRNGGGQSAKVSLAGSSPASKVGSEEGSNPTMDVNQRRRVNNALAVLMTSSNGKRIVLTVVPGADGPVTDADLEKHGIQLRMRQDGKRGDPLSSVSSGTAPGGGRIVVIAFQNAVIDERNDPRDMAALFGGEIDQVGYQDRAGWKLPSVLLDWRKRVSHAIILVDLGVKSFATRASTLLGQGMQMDGRIYQGHLDARPLTGDEFYSDHFETQFGTLRESEKSFAMDGIDLLLVYTMRASGTTSALLSGAIPGYANMKMEFSKSMRSDFVTP